MQKKVLLVEDRPGSLKSLGEKLGMRDFQVFEAFGIEQGVATAEEFRPDLIVFELGAPRGDGLADLERMTEYAERRGIQVAYVSAHDSDAFRSLTRENGAVGYFEEPYEAEHLLMLISMALSKPVGVRQAS